MQHHQKTIYIQKRLNKQNKSQLSDSNWNINWKWSKKGYIYIYIYIYKDISKKKKQH